MFLISGRPRYRGPDPLNVSLAILKSATDHARQGVGTENAVGGCPASSGLRLQKLQQLQIEG